MQILDHTIDVLSRDDLTVAEATDALAGKATIQAVPGTDHVSHADIALDQPLALDALVARYGDYRTPPMSPSGRERAFFEPAVPEGRGFTVALIVTVEEDHATTATVRRDAR